MNLQSEMKLILIITDFNTFLNGSYIENLYCLYSTGYLSIKYKSVKICSVV